MSLLVACWVGSVVVALLLPSPVGLLLRARGEAPLNLVHGVTLPDADDPRWERQRSGEMQLGAVVVNCDGAGYTYIAVAGVCVAKCEERYKPGGRYGAAVITAYANRKALAAITDT